MSKIKTKRVVVITGGTKGIGKEIAEAFIRNGDHVAVCSRSTKGSTFSNGTLTQDVDVRNRDSVHNFVKKVVSQFGPINIWVNCAGISKWKPLKDIDETFFREIYETNVSGTLWGSQAAAEAMKNGGSIINVSSLAGKRGSANNSAYCASKFAVNGITQALAKELGPKQIRVNAVCPVYVETETILASLKENDSPVGGGSVRTYLDQFASTQTALKRLPTEKNIAETVIFLASPAAEAISGQCLNVDCGTLPQ